MDFDQYVAARYGRLVEHAVLLGCAEGEAGTYVDQVLVEQRKRIRRAEDPDPLVREALERAIAGSPTRPSRTGPLVAVVLVLVAAAVGVALTYRPPPDSMPSLFALTGDQAEKLLHDQGYDVLVRPARSCEPPGLVVGSDPPGGGPVQKGATVTVRTSVLAGSQCEPQYPVRAAAWQFVQYALGQGEAPELADPVRLLVSGSMPRTFFDDEANDRSRWREAFDLVDAAAHQVAPTDSGLPVLHVESSVPPATWCGVPRPPEVGRRPAVRFEIDARQQYGDGCPLAVDLYRTDGAIDTVVVYRPQV